MRQKSLAIFLALPSVEALSLGNFQQITSLLIPLTCQLTYDGQIPTCTASDFNNGCSTACQYSLLSVAQEVASSCDDVVVSASTLLGIILDGGIIAALCPTIAKTTSTTSAIKTTAITSKSVAADSVTIPTSGPGVTGGLGLTTSASVKVTTATTPKATTVASVAPTSVPIAQSQPPSKTSSPQSSVPTFSAAALSTTLSSTGGGIMASISSSTSPTTLATTAITTAATPKGSGATKSSTTSAPSKQTPVTSKSNSGGGSPFDIQPQNGASYIGGSSTLYILTVAVWACVLFRR